MSDEKLMRRAIELARRAEGRTSPNPLVGCVLSKDGEIVAEGWHEGPGLAHAEAMALAAAGDRARGATAHVTLEPCNHHGRTPPCSDALIAAGVAEIVYGHPDPNPLAKGGADRLAAAGLKVRRGPCAREAEALMRPWLYGLRAALPLVTAKFACSLDGRSATRTGSSQWITGPAARASGHDLRQRADAVLAGIGTVLADDPALDPRPEGRPAAPSLKVVLDTHLRTREDAKLLSSPGPVLIACGHKAEPAPAAALEARGAEIVRLPLEDGRVSLRALLAALKARGCLSVLIEGGPALLGAAFDQGLVDEVAAFIAPMVIGGGIPAIAGIGPGPIADAFRLEDVKTENLGGDIAVFGRIVRKEAACSLAS